MTTFQKRLAIGAIISLIAIIVLLFVFFPFSDFRLGNSVDGKVKSQAEALFGRLDRTIKKIEQKESEVKNDIQAYAHDKKTNRYLDSLKNIREELEAYREKAQPLSHYKNKEELSEGEPKDVHKEVLSFIDDQTEIDSVIGVTDVLYHNFHKYQIAEKDQTIEEQAEQIRKYKQLAKKYRSLYTNLNMKLEKSDTIIRSLEAKIDSIYGLQGSETKQPTNNTDSLKQALIQQKQIAEALRDSVSNFPQFEIIKLSPTPYEAKNFKKTDHWNLRHIEKNGFFVELQVENFKHPYDTLQLRIIVDVPINKTEYKALETEITYNFKNNTHNKIEFFPKDLRKGVINFSVFRGSRFLRLETMQIRKPTLFPSKVDESDERKRNIDPNFEK